MQKRVVIAGGGPAGMMLGLLLARAGLRVAVLEKHADFLRDFRGDTIHPSTLQLLHELGLVEAFLRLPKLIGLQPARRIPLWNGALECRLYEFDIVAGTHRKLQRRPR